MCDEAKAEESADGNMLNLRGKWGRRGSSGGGKGGKGRGALNGEGNGEISRGRV